MKIYIATSWKSFFACRILATLLRKEGHEVYDFTDPACNSHVFSMAEYLRNPLNEDGSINKWYEHQLKPEDIDQQMMNAMPQAQKAFKCDMEGVLWADVIVLLLPAGCSAHMEAGLGKGKGKLLYITGTQKPGDYDVMRLMADGFYDLEGLLEVLGGGKQTVKEKLNRLTAQAVRVSLDEFMLKAPTELFNAIAIYERDFVVERLMEIGSINFSIPHRMGQRVMLTLDMMNQKIITEVYNG